MAGAQTLRGDVNGDGTVDIADVTTLVSIILNGEEEGDDEVVIGPSQPSTDNRAVALGSVALYATWVVRNNAS